MTDVKKPQTKNRFVVALFLFCITFVVIYFVTDQVSKVVNIGSSQISALISLGVSLIMVSSQIGKKRRDFENIEHGSARWGKYSELSKLRDKDYSENLLFSKNVRLSMDMRKTRRNRHALIFGGSGSGKSRYYLKPNVLQMNASYVIADPKGEHLKSEGKMLEENGYRIKVLNVVDLKQSMQFNPMVYFKETRDIRRFVNMLIQNTTGDNPNGNVTEDFWVKAERLWLMACLSYINETCEHNEKNLISLITMLDNSQAKDDDEDFKSAVDILFDELEGIEPSSFAVKQYKKYKLAAGKTAKSILISIGVRLSDLDIPEIAELLSDDELDLETIGDKKTALFIIIDDLEISYNYIVAIMLDVMFNALKRKADSLPSECLDIPVNCYLDELANIGRFPNLHILIAVMRSRGVSLHLIFQNLGQLKSVYKDHWATIEGNCDTTVFLGGKGEDMQKYVSNVMVGKTTIDTLSTGGSGGVGTMGLTSYNKNEQKTGRNLIDEAEVAKLADNECIINIRGFEPFKDVKYETEKHKNYRFLGDCDESRIYTFVKPGSINLAAFNYVTQYELPSEEDN